MSPEGQGRRPSLTVSVVSPSSAQTQTWKTPCVLTDPRNGSPELSRKVTALKAAAPADWADLHWT